MSQYFLPLKVFGIGMVALLLALVAAPTIDTEVAVLAANTSARASDYWGWSWLMTTGVVRWLWFVLMFLGVCLATGVAFLYSRRH